MQSPDVRTFLSLQTSLTNDPIFNDYVSQDDESEAARVEDMHGVGEPLYMTDADIGSYSMADYGFTHISADSRD